MPQNEIIFAVKQSPEGGFEARALGHSIFTEAETFDELKKMVHDAVLCHFSEESRPVWRFTEPRQSRTVSQTKPAMKSKAPPLRSVKDGAFKPEKPHS